MTTQERIGNAKYKINAYWNLMNIAAENNNDELCEYWLAKWGAAREIFVILTGEKWYHE